jgi:[acyl-carrier-protein] S-malonyltransferase
MAQTAFLFPGQGSQYVGMAKDICAADPQARSMMERADVILGVPLSRICFEGPEEELKQTKNTQPAIFLHSVIAYGLLRDPSPAMVAGHSLGEYSALVAAGAFTWEDALRIVRLRGELMQQAGVEQQGTMAAVVGLSPEVVEALCTEAGAAGVVRPANFNSPGQIVISGSVAGVRKAMELARGKGAKLVKELVVSGAFHSPLMESAREGLGKALAAAPIRDARIPVYANVSAEPVTRAADIRTLLLQQLTSPVRWEQTIKNMTRDGATEVVEVGPGKVLQGLVKRTSPDLALRGVDTHAEILQWGHHG